MRPAVFAVLGALLMLATALVQHGVPQAVLR